MRCALGLDLFQTSPPDLDCAVEVAQAPVELAEALVGTRIPGGGSDGPLTVVANRGERLPGLLPISILRGGRSRVLGGSRSHQQDRGIGWRELQRGFQILAGMRQLLLQPVLVSGEVHRRVLIDLGPAGLLRLEDIREGIVEVLGRHGRLG